MSTQPELRSPAGRRPVPARQSSLRDHNLGLALQQVAHAASPVSRADIAAATGLTRSTTSTLVDALLAAGLVLELGPGGPRTGAGRPASGLVVDPDGAAGVGLEVNVDYLAACVVDLAGAVRHREVRLGDQRGRKTATVLADLARLASRARTAAVSQGLPVGGASVALPGLVEAPDGPLRLAPNLGWRDVDVLAALRGHAALADLALSVDNEANLAALGELYTGGAGGARSFVQLSGEIGVGAGIVLDGEVFRGTHGWGGEIGHLAIRPDGPPCGCGARGCLEQIAGQEAILRAAGLATQAGTTMAGQSGVAQIVRLAEQGRPELLAALANAGTALGVAVAGVVNLLDVSTVVLGGLYAALAPWVAGPVEREIAGRVLAHAWSPVTVTVSKLGGDAAIRGAAGSVVQRVLDHPAARVA